MNKTFLLLNLALCLSPLSARAEFTAACGENRDRGAEAAEIGLVNDLISDRLYLAGQEIHHDRFGLRAETEDKWIVTIDGGAQGNRKFIFTPSRGQVQEYSVDSSGKERRVGNVKRCDWKESAMQDDEAGA